MGYDDIESEDDRIKAGRDPVSLVDQAADAALDAAKKIIEEADALRPETRILVLVDYINQPEDVQDCTVGYWKPDGAEPTIGDILELLLSHAMATAKAAGKELILAPIEQTPDLN